MYKLLYMLWSLAVTLSHSESAVVNIVLSDPPENVIRIAEYKKVGKMQVELSEKVEKNMIDITCTSLSLSSGDSKITFIKSSVQIGQKTSTISFNVLSPGRVITVQCTAQSRNSGLQFTEATSAGTKGYIQVTKRPTVSICSDVVVVPSTSVVNGSFDVLFSEIVSNNPVNVTCDIWSLVQANSLAMDLKFYTSVVPVNTAKTKVLYELVSKGDSVVVSCTASSVSATTSTENLQYTLDTSQGTTAVFTYQVPQAKFIPAIVKSLGQTTIGQTVSYLVLEKTATDVTQFECSMEIFEPSRSISCSGKASTVNMKTVNVNLISNNMTFEVGDFYKPLVVQVNGTNSERDQQLLRITCCRENADAKFYNIATTIRLWVDVYPRLQFTWDNISDSGPSVFSQFDPLCPCDLKVAHCDVGCCCDQDCSIIEKEAFPCIPGYYGGSSDVDFEYGCQDTMEDSQTYSTLLCVVRDNSPLLGMLYQSTSPPAADNVQFDALKGQSIGYEYREDEERSLVENDVTSNDITGYREGVIVQTDMGFLTFPRAVASSACVSSSPVVFLRDIDCACTSEILDTMCNEASVWWSALNYLVPNEPSQSRCLSSPRVLSTPDASNSTKVPTHVAYYCAQDVSQFITSFGGDWEQPDSKRSTFNNASISRDVKRCDFDDDVTVPPGPWYNATIHTCYNVVLKVEYNIYWRGTEIIQARVAVTTGNVQAQGKQLVHQRFSVKFLHLKDVDSSQLPFVQSTFRQRSGNPGYLVGNTVLAMMNDTSVNNGNQSTNATWQDLHLWSSSPTSGECSTTSTTQVAFGINFLTGCLLKLSLKDLSNCTALRHMVLRGQEGLVKATHVARYGNARLNNTDDWVALIRPSSPLVNPTTTNQTLANGTNQTLGYHGAEQILTSRCDQIPARLHYEFLVKRVGKTQGVEQTAIIGARYRYSLETWSFNCVGYNCKMCNDSTNCNDDIRSFEVTTSVVFLPVVETKRQKRSLDTSNTCYHDNCVAEFLYPLTESYDGETREVAIAYGLSLLALTLLLVALTTSCVPTVRMLVF